MRTFFFSIKGELMLIFLILLSWILTFYTYYPGLTTPDSDNQIMQVLSGVFSDNHPPFVTWLWGKLLFSSGNPAPIFIYHITMFWFSIYLLLSGTAKKNAKKILGIFILGFNPFIFNYVGNIWKDVFIYDFYFLITALLVTIKLKNINLNYWFKILMYLLIVVFSTSRWNIFFSGYIFILLLIFTTSSSKFNFSIKFLLSQFLIYFLIFILIQSIIYFLLHPIKSYIASTLFVYDLLGISIETNSYKLPHSQIYGINELVDCYDYKGWDKIWVSCMPLLDEMRASGFWEKLHFYWLQEVTSHPIEYLSHRFHFFLGQFKKTTLIFTYDPTLTTLEYGFDSSIFHEKLFIFYNFVMRSKFCYFFTNGFWIVISALMTYFIYLSLRIKKSELNIIIFLISLSGTLYSLPLLFIGTASDFRYVYWSIGSFFISSFLLLKFNYRDQ
jgi:hypothetical protein